MTMNRRDFVRHGAIAGIGLSKFGRGLEESQLELGLVAFKEALDDAGLTREDVDGLSIHMGWPLGVDYDRIAEVFGLDIRYVNQSWLHGRFVTNALQHAALAVASGMADCVACITAISFTRLRGFLGGPEDHEGTREDGGTPLARFLRSAALQVDPRQEDVAQGRFTWQRSRRKDLESRRGQPRSPVVAPLAEEDHGAVEIDHRRPGPRTAS